jgi:hypothetical protein
MYVILKNKRRYNKELYASYEAARSYVRKILRKNPKVYMNLYSNPSITYYGFSISKKV